MKKYLSLVLVLAMALTLLCGTVAFGEGEKRVLTIGSQWGEGDEWFNGELFQKYLNEINCEIQFTYYDSDPFAALLAGGDLPDIIIADSIMSNVMSNGLAMNIAPYLEEYAPNMLKGLAGEAMKLSSELMGDGEGGIYLIPPCVGIHNASTDETASGIDLSRGYIVRWDYYKEIGCPPINSEEDYLNVLMQMQANHPTTEDGSPTYLWAFKSSDIGYRGAFIKTEGSSGVNHWSLYQFKSDIMTNDVINGYLDTENGPYWIDMKWVNMIYRANPDLLDMDAFTMTSDERDAKLAKGQYMGTKQGTSVLYKAEKEKNPDTIADYVVVPSENTTAYYNITMPLGNMPSRFLFVTKDCEQVDLALQFLNFIYDEDFCRQLYSGEQGVTWDYDENGVPKMTDEALADKAAGGLYWKDPSDGGAGYYGRITYLTGYNPGVLHSDGYPMNLASVPESAAKAMDPVQVDMCETYGVEFINDIFDGMTDFRNDMGEAIAACMTEIPMDKLRVIEQCNDILEVGKATLAFCESEEEFNAAAEEICAELRATGIEEIFEWYQGEWDKVKDLFNATREANAAAIGLELYPIQ